jgi:hypothetical protein
MYGQSVVRAPVAGELALANWRILRSGRGDRHFVGILVGSGQRHASLAITRLDLSTMTGVTRTGRTYRLVGLPAADDTSLQSWSKWCVIFCQPPPIDVTAETLASRRYQRECADGPETADSASGLAWSASAREKRTAAVRGARASRRQLTLSVGSMRSSAVRPAAPTLFVDYDGTLHMVIKRDRARHARLRWRIVRKRSCAY